MFDFTASIRKDRLKKTTQGGPMANDKFKSLFKSWDTVKDQIQECLNDKNVAEKKEKIMTFVEKAREELTDVIEKDINPLIAEGKKEFGKLQHKIEKMVTEKSKPAPKKKAAPKKKPAKKASKKK